MTVNIHAPTSHDSLTLAELQLYHDLMAYRASLGLAPVQLSLALTTTAGRHVVDMRENVWAAGRSLPADGSLHSWSDAPYVGHPEAMWRAPARLGVSYPSSGYEIATAGLDAAGSLAAWKASAPHNAIITESGAWSDKDFLAVGVGLETAAGAGPYGGKVAYVWFGTVADPAGAPAIAGTRGADSIAGTAFADAIYAGGGNDRVNGGLGSDRIRGEAGDDVLVGWRANDSMTGDDGNDLLDGGTGDDSLRGGTGNDRLLGGDGNDWLSGDDGDDLLEGGAGADGLYGGWGRDTLVAADGDVLDGGANPDRLFAGLRHDLLTGGGSPDQFIFTTARAAGLGATRDLITDFQKGADVINLTGIDANPLVAGDQAFAFRGTAAFSGHAGELRVTSGAFEGDANGDGLADFRVALSGGPILDARDFLL